MAESKDGEKLRGAVVWDQEGSDLVDEEVEDGEREPADEEDGDHGDEQPAGPVIASLSLSWSVTPPTSSSSGCLPAKVSNQINKTCGYFFH